MTGVVQSGNVTPGHLVVWVTDGVVKDGGPALTTQQVLASLLSADFNSIGDQALNIPTSITAFMVTGIVVTNASIELDTAAGGFYPEASKAGTALVDASQVYTTLVVASDLLSCTLSADAQATKYTSGNLPDWAVYLSLTTAQGASATADVYLLGVDLTA